MKFYISYKQAWKIIFFKIKTVLEVYIINLKWVLANSYFNFVFYYRSIDQFTAFRKSRPKVMTKHCELSKWTLWSEIKFCLGWKLKTYLTLLKEHHDQADVDRSSVAPTPNSGRSWWNVVSWQQWKTLDLKLCQITITCHHYVDPLYSSS